MQIRLCRGSRTVMSLRLCSRAPWTTSSSEAITDPVYRGGSDRTSVRSVLWKAPSGAVPRPLGGALAQACADGVEEHVLACVAEVILALDRAGAVAAREQVAEPFVTSVEPLRVH